MIIKNKIKNNMSDKDEIFEILFFIQWNYQYFFKKVF